MEYLSPRRLRNRASKTQRQIGEYVGVKRETVSDWENKGIVPHLRPSQFKRMLEAYECTVDELIEAFEGDG